jgi:GABA(A) receptor-associated protein
MENFKSEVSLEKRKFQTHEIIKRHPDRLPVFVYKKGDTATKNKYLVPRDITVAQFMYILRKNINITSDKGIFIFVDNVLPPNSSLMSTLYMQHADEDGYLYITYAQESVFGFGVGLRFDFAPDGFHLLRAGFTRFREKFVTPVFTMPQHLVPKRLHMWQVRVKPYPIT